MNSRCAIVAWLECFPEKPSWCHNEQVCRGRSVKRFERSNRLDTALYDIAVVCSGGEELSAFYLDPYTRPHQKLGGAWMEVGRGTSTSFVGV